MITIKMMKINENFVHEVLMVTMLLIHDCIRWPQLDL